MQVAIHNPRVGILEVAPPQTIKVLLQMEYFLQIILGMIPLKSVAAYGQEKVYKLVTPIHIPSRYPMSAVMLPITTYRRILPHIFGGALHSKPLSENCLNIRIRQHQTALVRIRIPSETLIQQVVLEQRLMAAIIPKQLILLHRPQETIIIL